MTLHTDKTTPKSSVNLKSHNVAIFLQSDPNYLGQKSWVILLDLMMAIRQRRLRYLGHLPPDSVVRRTLMAMPGGGNRYPEESLFVDCQGSELKALDYKPHCMAVQSGDTCVLKCYTVPLDPLGPLWTLDRLPVLRTWGTAFVHGLN